MLDTCRESHTPTSTRTPSADVSRKQRHNLREQRRILRLGSQFDHLKATLEAAGLITNKKDKHSILQATIEYIAALEYDAHARMTPSSSQPTSISCTYGKKDQHSIPPTSPPISTNDPMDSADLHIRSLRTHPHSIEYLWMPELVADSTASFHQVFLHASVPSAIARLDGSLVHASHLFLQHFPNSMGLSLYGLCVGLPNVHKMQSLVTTLIAGDGRSAQTKMTWQAPGTSPKPVFVSVALVRDATGQPVNIQCTALPMVA
ncbi:hypothetical protein DYB30_001565 [Aphanomyces astaci]|uniref:BHLH domain-containing protein n=1 Tax=Aphanomyces astaci TaxID=112090 RepID=A0A397C938_APHAT|nr:hypothetical protein DYB30_001565 [Aphanomyces astaci]